MNTRLMESDDAALASRQLAESIGTPADARIGSPENLQPENLKTAPILSTRLSLPPQPLLQLRQRPSPVTQPVLHLFSQLCESLVVTLRQE